MTRTILLGAAILACLPMIAFGQTKKAAAKTEAPCCGQAATVQLSPQEMMQETQLNLQGILMQDSGGKRLSAGDYLISVSPEGYEFRALVSKQGIVDGWYLADLEGMPVMLLNTGGGGQFPPGTIGFCFIKYSSDISACASLEKNWPNRYQLCIDNAWRSLMACMGGLNGGVIMR
jgi:hypothetical protein